MAGQNLGLLRVLTPASTLLSLLLFRFIFIQIPKLRYIVSQTNNKIPIAEFQIYTKLYVISSISGIVTLLLSYTEDVPGQVNLSLIIVYAVLYAKFLRDILTSTYFNNMWKSQKVAYAVYLAIGAAVVARFVINPALELSQISTLLINWTPVLLFISGLVSVKNQALKFNTVNGLQNYQPTHEFLQFTEIQTSLSQESLDDYKKCDFHNFAFYSLFLYVITNKSYNYDNSELVLYQIGGLAVYAVINAYLYHWYGTSFLDFRVMDSDVATFKSSVELMID